VVGEHFEHSVGGFSDVDIGTQAHRYVPCESRDNELKEVPVADELSGSGVRSHTSGSSSPSDIATQRMALPSSASCRVVACIAKSCHDAAECPRGLDHHGGVVSNDSSATDHPALPTSTSTQPLWSSVAKSPQR
jgi:hypothetical protein